MTTVLLLLGWAAPAAHGQYGTFADDVLYGAGDAPLSVAVGDLDGGGVVGFGDPLIAMDAWGLCEGCCMADLDGSGDVGFNDLLIVLGAWEACE